MSCSQIGDNIAGRGRWLPISWPNNSLSDSRGIGAKKIRSKFPKPHRHTGCGGDLSQAASIDHVGQCGRRIEAVRRAVSANGSAGKTTARQGRRFAGAPRERVTDLRDNEVPTQEILRDPLSARWSHAQGLQFLHDFRRRDAESV